MSDTSSDHPGLGAGTDISAADLDVEAPAPAGEQRRRPDGRQRPRHRRRRGRPAGRRRLTPQERAAQLDAAVRGLFGERWAATGVLDDVLVVAVRDGDDADVARLQELVPGAGLVPVAASRDDLEARMDAVEDQLTASGELAGFLQMAPDGFRSVVRVVVDAPVPALRAWAAEHLPPDGLEVEEQAPGT